MVTASPDAATPDDRPAVVAVCASAASPQPLLQLLRALTPHSDMALVIVLQHREALDTEPFMHALREAGHVPSPIAPDAPLEPGKTYLPDPDVIVSLENGRFRIRAVEEQPGARGTIDSFLVALAGDEDGHSIAVILAGTGADGTLGLKAVKAAGGLALAEETEESRSSELARSNHPAALADAVLPIDQLAERIKDGVRQIEPAAGLARPDDAEVSAALAGIAGVLRKRTGHDFHGYKPGTFLRRVQRRVQVVQVTSIGAYLDLLRERPDEAQELFNDLLIGVTQFFRDPHEFDLLAREIVPKLFAGKAQNDRLRVWVIGCSTGEEAYSLGILLREHMATLDDAPQVQIFATDLDGRALAAARAARYAATIADDMSPERLARWFVKEGNTYCVVKELREMCIFSQHSIIKDAPFSRVDIVSCRNLLIYLDAELQNHVIPLFHFALRPDGVLFLGNSENVSRHTHLFAPLENRSRVFRRLEAPNRLLPNFPFTVASLPAEKLPARNAPPRAIEPSLAQRAERFAERYAPAYVILDERYNVLHFSARTGRYLDPVGGAATLNLLQLIHPDLRFDVREALSRAAEAEGTVELEDRRIGLNGHSLVVDLVVEPVKHASGPVRSYFVLFKDGHAAPGPEQIAATSASDQQAYIQQLEAELRETRERLQATAEEAETTSEELKASNEEYQSLNEELQAANEELQTSKEELQSLNEELTTVNGELSLRVQELGRSNSDLKNFLESTQIATIFLDNELRVTNYTPAVTEIFHLVETDVGRPIGHIKSRLAYDDLQTDARRVLRTLAAAEREIESVVTGAHYMVRVLPYRSIDNFIAGVVITFVDITARKRTETDLRESQERFRLVVENARDHAIFTLDPENRITDWYPSAEAVFGWTADEAIGQSGSILYTPADRRHGEDVKELEEARREGSAPNVRWHLRKDGARVFIEGTTRALHHADGSLRGFLKIGQDTTNRRETREALRASETRQLALIEGIPQLVWRSADYGQWTWGSPQWLSFTGQSQEESVGLGWLDAVHPDDRDAALEAWEQAAVDGVLAVEYRIRRAADGAWLWHHTRSLPVRDAEGRTVEWLGTSTDIDAIRQLQARQEVLVNELQHRARNLLGVVSAVADRTVKQGGSVEAFEERLQALSRAQGLLSQGGNDTVDVGALVRAELAAYTDEASPAVAIAGPEVRLKARQVQNFALALHELTTNAVKYGALKDGSGRLSITWDLAHDESTGRRLALRWIESGVAIPQGAAPRRGYGTELIQEALAYALQAEVEYVLEPGGVRCRIEMPVS
jgi:two-component system CheB/CheR fusion protein